MKQLAKIYTNWRCVLLIALAAITLLLAIAESDSIRILLASKLLAASTGLICAFLGLRWAAEGKIDDLLKISE